MMAIADSIDLRLIELEQRINNLRLRTPSSQLSTVRSMDRSLPISRRVKGLAPGATPRVFRYECWVGKTRNALDRERRIVTAAGLNELDARVNLGKQVRKANMHLIHVINYELVAK